MKIEIFSDVVCPWCWIGEQRLLRALDGFDRPVELTWRAFQLDPTAESNGTPLVQWLGRRYGGEAVARRMFDNVTEVGRAEGLDFAFDRAVAANTFDAHRLSWWAREQGSQREMIEALHRAHFVDGLDIGSPAVLETIATGLGYDAATVRDVIASDAGAREVTIELETARDIGITGVPTFVIDQRYAVTGAQDADTLRRVLDEVAGRETPLTTLTPEGHGESCTDDSCAV